MFKFCEPLYKLILYKGEDSAFQKAMDFAQNYKIKSIDKENRKITLDLTIPMHYVSLLPFWIKEVIIEVKRKTPKETELDVYGKYPLSPHNIFLIPTFKSKEIERRFFIRELRKCFEGKYEG